jgi:hypothetical protein
MSSSAKRSLYSDMPSEVSHSVIVATYSLAFFAAEHDTSTGCGNGDDPRHFVGR